MTRKLVTLLAVAVVLLAACGREGEEAALDVVAQESATPTPTQKAADPDATATPKPKATATAAPDATATPAAADDPTPAPAPKADEGDLNEPKVGTYTYDISGSASDPFNPAAGQQPYEGTRTTKLTRSGAVTTAETTNSESPGRTTLRTRRESSRIVLLSIKQETAQGDFSCTFNPPPMIARIPVKVEKFPTQSLNGSGNACGGKLDITVRAKETVKDANGTSFSTWPVLVDQTTETSQFKLHTVETRWVSPDLGIEVRSDGETDGEIKAGATSTKFSGTGKSVLRDRP